MDIQVIATSLEDKGKYSMLEVTYKSEGQTKAKKLMSFGAGANAFATLKAAQNGEVFQVTSQKNDKGFWDWINVTKGGSATASVGGTSVAASPSPRSTYETPEERAHRQILIVRQSSVSSAIEYLKLNGKKTPNVNDVLEAARAFEDFVFGHAASDPSGMDFVDDIL